MQRYVTGFSFSTDKSMVVLIKKTKPEWQAGKLNGVGGKVEENETLPEAMVREFREETGLETKVEEWIDLCTIEGSDFSVTFYSRFADDFDQAKTTTEEEVGVYSAIEAHIIPELYIPNLTWLIPMALDDKSDRVSVLIRYNGWAGKK